MQKALTYLQVELRDPSELQTPIAQCDINSMSPLSYRLRMFSKVFLAMTCFESSFKMRMIVGGHS